MTQASFTVDRLGDDSIPFRATGLFEWNGYRWFLLFIESLFVPEGFPDTAAVRARAENELDYEAENLPAPERDHGRWGDDDTD